MKPNTFQKSPNHVQLKKWLKSQSAVCTSDQNNLQFQKEEAKGCNELQFQTLMQTFGASELWTFQHKFDKLNNSLKAANGN